MGGFYYEGFYYDGFYYNQPQGFYYDERDAGFNQGNKDYWYKGDGKKRMLAALNGIRTRTLQHCHHRHLPQCHRKVCHKRQPQRVLQERRGRQETGYSARQGDPGTSWTTPRLPKGMAPRGIQREEGHGCRDQHLIPFMVTWVADQEFHTPNGNQD